VLQDRELHQRAVDGVDGRTVAITQAKAVPGLTEEERRGILQAAQRAIVLEVQRSSVQASGEEVLRAQRGVTEGVQLRVDGEPLRAEVVDTQRCAARPSSRLQLRLDRPLEQPEAGEPLGGWIDNKEELDTARRARTLPIKKQIIVLP